MLFRSGFLGALALATTHYLVPESYEHKRTILFVAVSFIEMNFALGLFNLLPIPPLDGSQILLSLLPYNLTVKLYEFWGRFQFLLFILVFMGAFQFIFRPIAPLAELSVFVAERIIYFPLHLFGLA